MTMRAAVFEAFQSPLQLKDVADLKPHGDGAIIQVHACGICRSDWHAWMGHDSEVRLPHVPGHELAGTVLSVGPRVSQWRPGDRVTAPFCCGCGACEECKRGNTHICDAYTQPGFTHWGAFAEQVEIRHADINLVGLPDAVDYVAAASLGCRFATSFRALVDQARLQAGEWVAIHGCGGVGLSAIMIAKAMGALTIAIDPSSERRAMATMLGATESIDPSTVEVVKRIREITERGAQVSIDALGHHQTCWNSVSCLAKRGRHVQIGLMLGSHSDPPIPMSAVIAGELEIYGSHGMQAVDYPRLLRLIVSRVLAPDRLVTEVVSLERGADLLTKLSKCPNPGITVIDLMGG
jgi:alcohol dehydrogenase